MKQQNVAAIDKFLCCFCQKVLCNFGRPELMTQSETADVGNEN